MLRHCGDSVDPYDVAAPLGDSTSVGPVESMAKAEGAKAQLEEAQAISMKVVDSFGSEGDEEAEQEDIYYAAGQAFISASHL